MDEMDKRIIAALRHNARASLSDLAVSLQVTRSTVRARMAKLEHSGEIVGYTVRTRDDVTRDAVRGMMMVGIEGRGTERITRQLASVPHVRALHSTNGRWDVIVEIGTDTLEAFDAVLHQIRRLDGVVSSETSLMLKTRKAT